jgi:hypothetical protein
MANLVLFALWIKTHLFHKNVQQPPRANIELGSLWHVRSGGAHFVIAPVPGGRRMRLNLLFIASILKRSSRPSSPLASYSRMTDFLIFINGGGPGNEKFAAEECASLRERKWPNFRACKHSAGLRLSCIHSLCG